MHTRRGCEGVLLVNQEGWLRVHHLGERGKEGTGSGTYLTENIFEKEMARDSPQRQVTRQQSSTGGCELPSMFANGTVFFNEVEGKRKE